MSQGKRAPGPRSRRGGNGPAEAEVEENGRANLRSRLRETTSQRTEQPRVQRASPAPAPSSQPSSSRRPAPGAQRVTDEPRAGSSNQIGTGATARGAAAAPVTVSSRRRDARQREHDDRAREKDTLVKNGVLYLTCCTGNKLPIKKSEFMQKVFGKDKRDAKMVLSVISKIQKNMKNVLGFTIWGFNETTAEYTEADIHQAGYAYWFVISNHKGITNIINKVKEHSPEDKVREMKQALLTMFLTVIFMQNFDVGIEESQLWNTVTTVGFDVQLEIADDKAFKKFMRTEYVAPMYLKLQEERNDDQGVTIVRYSWGARAHVEISKWTIFKHAVRQFPGRKPQDFAGPYQHIVNSDEARLARHELKEWEKHENGTDTSSEEEIEDGNEGEEESEPEFSAAATTESATPAMDTGNNDSDEDDE